MGTWLRGAALALVLALTPSSDGRAAPITWQLEGYVAGIFSGSSIDPLVPPDPELTALGVVPGAPFAATIVLEPTTPDVDPSPLRGDYRTAVLSVDVTAGGYHVALAGADQLVVNVEFQLFLFSIFVPPYGNVFTNPLLGLDVVADVPGTFPSDAFPVVPPPLSSLHPFDPGEAFLGFGTSFAILGPTTSSPVDVRAAITRWELVPEPDVALIALAALGGVFASRRLRRD